MDAGLIDIKDLAGYLKKKWIIILTAVLLCGILFNFYGISRENRDATNSEQRHMEYVEAAEKLPGYYTEALFNLRSRLSDHAAEFVEAVQDRQGFYVSCIEEIAWRRGFITRAQLKSLGEELKMTEYGQYILSLTED